MTVLHADEKQLTDCDVLDVPTLGMGCLIMCGLCVLQLDDTSGNAAASVDHISGCTVLRCLTVYKTSIMHCDDNSEK